MRKTEAKEVKWAFRTPKLNQDTNRLPGYCGSPDVRKRVPFLDHDLKVWAISNAPNVLNISQANLCTMSAHAWACPTGLTPSSGHEDTPCWGPWHSMEHRPLALTRAFLPSHILAQILSQPCRRPGTIKKMFTHLPVMPNVWTLIIHLNSKKINRHHLSQPEKTSDSFTVFRRAPAQPPGSPVPASGPPTARAQLSAWSLCRWSWANERCLPFIQAFELLGKLLLVCANSDPTASVPEAG